MRLVGREGECGRIDGLLAGARSGRSGVLFLRGEAGIGKSALLDYAYRSTAAMRPLLTHGVESEANLPFAGLSELLLPVVDRIDGLPGPQAAALRGALALGPPSGDRFAVAAGTLSLLAAVAEDLPLLVLVDDAQWLDVATGEVLAFAARRLGAEGIAMILAGRTGEASPFDTSRLPELTVAGIDEVAARALIATTGVSVTAAEAGRIVEDARGNPLVLLELPGLVARSRPSGGVPSGPLPVGPAIEHVFSSRLDDLPADTRRALVVAAAEPSEATGPILDALAALELARTALEPAEVDGLITVHPSRIEWRHPLLRSVVYHAAPPPQRRAAHAALAATASMAADAAVWHRAAAAVGPDAAIADALESLANAARSRNAPAAAALAFERAARFTVDREVQARRLYEAAGMLEVSGHADDALRLLDEARGTTRDEIRRADIDHGRGRIEMFRGQPLLARSLMLEAAGRVERLDPDRATMLIADASTTASMTGDLAIALSTAERALLVAGEAGPAARLVAKAIVAQALVVIGQAGTDPRATDYLAEVQKAVVEAPIPLLGLIPTAGYAMVLIEDYAGARELFERAVTAARESGAIGLLAFPLGAISDLDFRVGRWLASYAAATEATRLAVELEHTNLLAFDLQFLARVEAGLGLVDEARAHAQEARSLAATLGSESIETYVSAILGQLELSLGNLDEAVAHLERAAALADRHGLGEPSIVQWAPDLIEAYARRADRAEAERLLEEFESQAATTGRRWAIAAAARCRGLMAADDAFEAAFATAMDWHAKTETPFELARTQLCLGERRRRARRRAGARDSLRSALTIFEQLGAAIWADRARQELRAAGADAPVATDSPATALTTQELQIALLVSEGRTNREAAAALFLSPRTIEHHLGSVYRKLRVRSRTELAHVLARGTRRPEGNA